MDTYDVIHAEEAYLVPHLQRMFTAELEHHAQEILKTLGSEHYKAILHDLTKALPNATIPQTEKFKVVQAIIAQYLPEQERNSDILQRLAVIMTLTLMRKHETILKNM